MKRLVVMLVIMLTSQVSLASSQVELILDASGSMYNKLNDGRFRITAAKDVLMQFIDGLPEDGLDVGLRIYGSRIKPGQPGACQDSELFVPIAGVDKNALSSAVKNTVALGSTPIAYSLQQAAKDFPAGAETTTIILVTDGKEVCDGDVRATVEQLKAQGFDIDLRIIGFDLSAEAAASFEGIGQFENATDAKALGQALGRAVQDALPEQEPLTEASLDAAEQVGAGTAFAVSWTAEDGPSDYVTIVKPDAPDGGYGSYQYVRAGNPVTLIAPIETGSYELRYQSDRVPGVAARRAVTVIESEVVIQAPTEITAGTPFQLQWRGPDGPQDYITIVPADARDGAYQSYQYTRAGSELTLIAPIEPGDYELRYQSDRSGVGVIGRVPVKVLEVEIYIGGPEQVNAGESFTITWGGPNGPQDYITIVQASAEDGKYTSYAYTRQGESLTLVAPIEPGPYELRYQSDRISGVFARTPIQVNPLQVTLDAVDSVQAGAEVEVTWEGPNGPQDYITIVPASAVPGQYGQYIYTRTGSPSKFRAPAEAGQYEIRYQSDRAKGIVFGARKLEVVE